jgi:predicted nuclease with TOPRIM domain
MSKEIKFTEEEISEINSLRENNQTKILEFGQVRMETLMTRKRLTQLDELEAKLEDDVNTLQKKELDLVDSLTKKYGVGSLDLESGVFRPTEQN